MNELWDSHFLGWVLCGPMPSIRPSSVARRRRREWHLLRNRYHSGVRKKKKKETDEFSNDQGEWQKNTGQGEIWHPSWFTLSVLHVFFIVTPWHVHLEEFHSSVPAHRLSLVHEGLWSAFPFSIIFFFFLFFLFCPCGCGGVGDLLSFTFLYF